MHKDGYSKLPSERCLLLDLVGLIELLDVEISNEFVADDQRSQLPLLGSDRPAARRSVHQAI
eukprot:4491693-Pyramimonas_sp.AAC.1